MAYYRVGNYEKALETLLRSDQTSKTESQISRPADLAFLAMTQQQLGQAKEAQAELLRLREQMNDPRWAQNAEAQGFLREAEALLAKPKAPASEYTGVGGPRKGASPSEQGQSASGRSVERP